MKPVTGTLLFLLIAIQLYSCRTVPKAGNRSNIIITYTIADSSFRRHSVNLKSMVVLPGQQLSVYIANSTPRQQQVEVYPNTGDLAASPSTALLHTGDTMKVTVTSQTAATGDTVRFTHLYIRLHQAGGDDFLKTINLFYRKADKSK